MIDWPNALVGFGSGVLTTVMFWIPDRIRATRQRRDEIWESWKIAMKDIELLMWRRETRTRDIYEARSRYPIDHWRSVLKEPEGFTLLEQVEAAYSSVEHFANLLAVGGTPENRARFVRAESDWNAARTALSNYSRRAQSESYQQLLRREDGRRIRRQVLREPITTIRRLIRMRKPSK
ncbi:hypothetical protein [Sinomonas sp. G460-2]|uniref:hypothetical protein n=1 Tax=Sinomonas sp. G460-2 TaxID=3393464 RepID=UPI0039EFE626